MVMITSIKEMAKKQREFLCQKIKFYQLEGLKVIAIIIKIS